MIPQGQVVVDCPLCGEGVIVPVTLRATRVGDPVVGPDGVQRLPVVVAVRPGPPIDHPCSGPPPGDAVTV